jgi:hypothetical protein
MAAASLELLPLKVPSIIPASRIPRIPLSNNSGLLSSLGWNAQTHILSAAYPRTRKSSAKAKSGYTYPFDENFLKRKADEAYEIMANYQAEAPRLDEYDESEEVLLLAVKRFWPKVRNWGSDNAVTLVVAHANGMHKEVRVFRASLIRRY